jgi:hypothetical protein
MIIEAFIVAAAIIYAGALVNGGLRNVARAMILRPEYTK